MSMPLNNNINLGKIYYYLIALTYVKSVINLTIVYKKNFNLK